MQSTIAIRDHPCGSDKTNFMIEGFQGDRKYLVIVPPLSEVERVIKGANSFHFQQPHANDNEACTKTESLKAMVLQGHNIAATHSLHERLVPIARDGLLSDYDIIIDEVPEVVRSVTSKSKTSIEEFYLNRGFMSVRPLTGQVAGVSNSSYCGTVTNALKNLGWRQLKDVPAENILITCPKAA